MAESKTLDITSVKPLTMQQEKFFLEFIQTGHVAAASLAVGVSPVTGSRWKALPAGKARIAELLAEAKEWKMLSAEDRRVMLSDQARGEIPTTTEAVKTGTGKLKRLTETFARKDAIVELNRLDRLYTEQAPGTTNNTQINIIVHSEKAQDMLKRIIAGERTERELPFKAAQGKPNGS